MVVAASGALTWSLVGKGKQTKQTESGRWDSVPNRGDSGLSSRWKLVGKPLLAHPSSRWMNLFELDPATHPTEHFQGGGAVFFFYC